MGLAISGRRDGLLLGGFTIALLIIFQRGLQYSFDFAREIEETGDLNGAALVERADRARYQAKASGKNCVRSAPAPSRSLAARAAVMRAVPAMPALAH